MDPLKIYRQAQKPSSARHLQPTDADYISKRRIRKATRTRLNWATVSSVFLLLTVVFLIVAEVGDTSKTAGIDNIYFISLNLQDVIPESIPNGRLLNSIAQTLGLHDFYSVGLWGYCQGYIDRGITSCFRPDSRYWFNPVDIIQSQLLAGASIQLPEDITHILRIIRIASHVMFSFFLAGLCLSFVLIFIKPFMVESRWAALGIGLLGFVNAALIIVATVIATVMFVIMSRVFNDAQQVNIQAHIGISMFGMIWVATTLALLSWIIDLALMCCCASRRDVRSGRKRGNKKAYDTEKEQP